MTFEGLSVRAIPDGQMVLTLTSEPWGPGFDAPSPPNISKVAERVTESWLPRFAVPRRCVLQWDNSMRRADPIMRLG
jgi:hypothetical protein